MYVCADDDSIIYIYIYRVKRICCNLKCGKLDLSHASKHTHTPIHTARVEIRPIVDGFHFHAANPTYLVGN